MLTRNVVNKVVAFEMICRENGVLLDSFVFKFFFRLSATGDKYTFSTRRIGHVLFLDDKSPKNWKASGYGLTKIESVACTTGWTTSLTSHPNCFPIIRLPLIFWKPFRVCLRSTWRRCLPEVGLVLLGDVGGRCSSSILLLMVIGFVFISLLLLFPSPFMIKKGSWVWVWSLLCSQVIL